MSRFPVPARIGFLAAAFVTGVTTQLVVALRPAHPRKASSAVAHSPTPAPSDRTPDPDPYLPMVNYRGPVYLIRDEGEDHPAPVVFPRAPVDIVTDDCKRLELFNTDDEGWDSENGVVTLSWWDRGINDARTLTVFTRSPSCARNASVRRHVGIIHEMLDQDGL